MTYLWKLIAATTMLGFGQVKLTEQSIAGVTYMDHFDFDERYRNVHECDPFYWHPLHLPPHCAKMFEKMIRSKVSSGLANRFVKKTNEYELISQIHPQFYDSPYSYGRSASPFGKMLDLVSSDVYNAGSHPPSIGMLPGIGPTLFYFQPVSSQSEKEIKRISSYFEQE